MSHRPRALAAFVVALASLLVVPTVAGAQSADDLRAQAATIEAQLAENGAHIAALGEELNKAQLELDTALATIAAADTKIAKAKAEIGRLQEIVQARAVAIYHQGGRSTELGVLGVEDVSEANSRDKYAEIAAAEDNRVLRKLAKAKADLKAEREAADRARQTAQAETDRLAQAKAEGEAAAAQQAALLGQVQGELAALVAQAQAARAATQTAKGSSSSSKPWDGPVPNPAGGAGAAVAFAQAQLGKPYQYAATGPDTYDCSGLTMRAWQAGGISLPHYSGAQGSMFPRVPLNQLQPGDLVTTSSWSQHVGIWVGGGYIHATHTGDVIKYVGGTGSVRDAVRPG